MADLVTVLDVVENFMGSTPKEGDVGKLQRAELTELGELARQSAETQSVLPHQQTRTYPGGFLASWWTEPVFESALLAQLLYQDSMLLHDPLADYFYPRIESSVPRLPRIREYFPNGVPSVSMRGPKIWVDNTPRYSVEKDDLEAARATVERIVLRLFELAPLIRSGTLVLRPQWPVMAKRKNQMVTSSRRDAQDVSMLEMAKRLSEEGRPLTVWDTLRGARVTAGRTDPRDIGASWQAEFFYMAKCLAIADAYASTYFPNTSADLELLGARLQGLHSLGPDSRYSDGVDSRVLATLAKISLPRVSASMKELVKIRENEECFEDWRRFVRDLDNAAIRLPRSRAERMIEDECETLAMETREAMQRPGLAKAIKQHGPGTALSIVSSCVPNVLGATSSAAAPIATTGSGVLLWLWKAYFGGDDLPSGRRRVAATLLTS